MADVRAQSVEDYADRIIYRYEPGTYNQVGTTLDGAAGVGLKTLVNSDTSRSYIVPASGLPARFYKINWDVVLSIVLQPVVAATTARLYANILRMEIPSLNYDGKALQTKFNIDKIETFYTSPQLRAINISDISIEPIVEASVYQALNATGATVFVSGGATAYLSATLQPTVTFYKK